MESMEELAKQFTEFGFKCLARIVLRGAMKTVPMGDDEFHGVNLLRRDKEFDYEVRLLRERGLKHALDRFQKILG